MATDEVTRARVNAIAQQIQKWHEEYDAAVDMAHIINFEMMRLKLQKECHADHKGPSH